MKTDKEWEARARELGLHDEMHVPGAFLQSQVLLALQLGREMADERAEEIARRIVDGLLPGHPNNYVDATARAARIARSTIMKPKDPEKFTELFVDDARGLPPLVSDEASIRADERRLVTKEILDRLLADGSGLGWSLRMTGGEPKTREQVLEEALRQLSSDCSCGTANRHGMEAECHATSCCRLVARHALEWKPE